ncbi:MAG: putative holin [Methylotenera sp.]
MKTPRLFVLILLNVLLLLVLLAIAPQQVPVTLYKLSLVTTAGLVGYWLDRAIFPYARPDAFLTRPDPSSSKLIVKPEYSFEFCFSMLRRAIIVAAAMLAMGLGA